MKSYLAYVRVSTVKQGEHGSSLQEQRDAIEAYAARHGLTIGQWFEETETAAKQGRQQFERMLSLMKAGKAAGLLIHKIDRSTRNLKDWARLGDLMDAGVSVHFVHESLDLASRGGRLAADIQAVVAADYIRNLRDEVRKGLYGRLKQGLYPLPAPRGYLDQGKGQPKAIDPVAGPLVRQAFELYATGTHTFHSLRLEMFRRGLRGKTGKPLSPEALSIMLHSPFYAGIIRIRKTNRVFEGIHEPLITKELYDTVQAMIEGRVFARPVRHAFTFRRMIRCASCGYSLIGENRKGHTYYRCHSATCPKTSFREDDIERAVSHRISHLRLTPEDIRDLRDLAEKQFADAAKQRAESEAAIRLALGKCDDRLSRLTDALVDGNLDKDTFAARNQQLLMERRSLREQLAHVGDQQSPADRVNENLGRANILQLGYDSANPEEKRKILRELTSDFLAHGKNLEIRLRNVFSAIENWCLIQSGAPCPCAPWRTTPLYSTSAYSPPTAPPARTLVEALSVAPPDIKKPAPAKRRYVPPPRRSRPEPPSPRDVIHAIRERRREEGDLALFDDFAD